MTVEIVIDIAHDPLRLWECGECFALVLKESQRVHIGWHTDLAAQVQGKKG